MIPNGRRGRKTELTVVTCIRIDLAEQRCWCRHLLLVTFTVRKFHDLTENRLDHTCGSMRKKQLRHKAGEQLSTCLPADMNVIFNNLCGRQSQPRSLAP